MRFYFLICFVLGALSCGSPQAEKQYTQPEPVPRPIPVPGQKPSFGEMQALMQRYCVDCHSSAAFVKTESGLVGSSAKTRVQNATMPPPYAPQMLPADKARFLSFF